MARQGRLPGVFQVVAVETILYSAHDGRSAPQDSQLHAIGFDMDT